MIVPRPGIYLSLCVVTDGDYRFGKLHNLIPFLSSFSLSFAFCTSVGVIQFSELGNLSPCLFKSYNPFNFTSTNGENLDGVGIHASFYIT